MQAMTTIGFDIAKSVFQVHANISDEEKARVTAEFADSLLRIKRYDLFPVRRLPIASEGTALRAASAGAASFPRS